VDESLKLRAESAEKTAKELEERVIRKRSNIPAQITPLMQDAIRRQSTLADRIAFEDGQEMHDDMGRFLYIQVEMDVDFWWTKTTCRSANPQQPVGNITCV
jgi:hypothetical protein